ncbi:MAG: GNAT family N-acetyltransferase [Chloroflexi bacterium]|nr:GNAT family N-acetyltransferase [Chloroflexota bacterium]
MNVHNDLNLPIDLGDNLQLRWATSADTHAVAEFNHRMHDENQDIDHFGALSRDFMEGKHPLIGPSDFTMVEDTSTGRIISSMNLISQTWSYGGVPFKLGRPELVGTDPEYRRRGLVRRQFEVIHRLSAKRGELMLAITGIPWYYRMFGYEMAMYLDAGCNVYHRDLPSYDAEADPYQLRPAALADLPFIRDLYQCSSKRYPYSVALSDDLWQYEFDGFSEYELGRRRWQILETKKGKRLGYVQHHPWRWHNALSITQVELKPGLGLLQFLPTLLHGLWQVGEATPNPADENAQMKTHQMKALHLRMGPDHPLYNAWKTGFHAIKPYAWYVRVPDLVAFLSHVRPALERHLVDSVAAGYSGELKWHNYRNGIHMTFEKGRITAIEAWSPEEWFKGDARFPDLTFLHLLCGRRRCAELSQEHADARANNKAEVLLDTLFPAFGGAPWVIG